MIVGIDPGHGGTNLGCMGSGLQEEQLTLTTALGVRQAMLQRDPNTHVILSREHDESVTLAERARRLVTADFVLCIHYDSAAGPEEGCLGTYAFADDAIARAAGERMEACAPAIIRPKSACVQAVSPDDWTVRAYNVLMHHRPKPALLVEVAFLSNHRHVEWLRGPEAQQDIAQLLCDGIGEGLLGVAKRAATGPVVA